MIRMIKSLFACISPNRLDYIGSCDQGYLVIGKLILWQDSNDLKVCEATTTSAALMNSIYCPTR